MGEGYEDLVAQRPSRSWMGVIAPQGQVPDRRHTPTQPLLGGTTANLRYPSPIKWEESFRPILKSFAEAQIDRAAPGQDTRSQTGGVFHQ